MLRWGQANRQAGCMACAWAACRSILPCTLHAQQAACTAADTHAAAQRTGAAARGLSSSGTPAGGRGDRSAEGDTNRKARSSWQRAARERWRAAQRAAAERHATGAAEPSASQDHHRRTAEDTFYNVHFESLGATEARGGRGAYVKRPFRGPNMASSPGRSGSSLNGAGDSSAGGPGQRSSPGGSQDWWSPPGHEVRRWPPNGGPASGRRGDARQGRMDGGSAQHSGCNGAGQGSTGVHARGSRGAAWFQARWGDAGGGINLDNLEELLQKQQQAERGGGWPSDKGTWHGRTPRGSGRGSNQDGGSGASQYGSGPWRSRDRTPHEHADSWWERVQAASAAWSGGTKASSRGGGASSSWAGGTASSGIGGTKTTTHTPAVVAWLCALGLQPDVCFDRAMLRAAFHKKAKQWHPDRHNDQPSKHQAEANFKCAAAAYEALAAKVT